MRVSSDAAGSIPLTTPLNVAVDSRKKFRRSDDAPAASNN
jgi:hypothetical protein